MAQAVDTLMTPAPDPWTQAMRRGDFTRAWQVSDAVLAQRVASGETCFHWPRHLQYVWLGESLQDKRVLIRCYHGLGDTIQFIRFAEPLRHIAKHVTVWVQPALLTLVATAKGVDEVMPLHDGTPQCEYDVDIEIMELAHALRYDPAVTKTAVPYLFPREAPSPARRPTSPVRGQGEEHGTLESSGETFFPSLPGRKQGEDSSAYPTHARIGIAWRAGDWEPRRSIPIPLLRDFANRCARLPHVELYSLQYGVDQRELAALNIPDMSCANIEEQAARMRTLDLVISVDTMQAHLAGALGLPVWTLLHDDCDWRWMKDSNVTPWYPTMRLFRQGTRDWRAVLSEVEHALVRIQERDSRASLESTISREAYRSR